MGSSSRIASRLREHVAEIRETLASVDAVVDETHAPDFDALREKLDGWAAKVAVIGQVKAGKSTLLNAFLGQHNFLPSDINPWTSVVTNLRFNLAADPETGVSFEFFSEEDWNEIIEGKSALGEVSDDLLPGFDADLLRQQSKELRDKAERRLGSHFHTLLGQVHEFNFASPDLLKRYVCAGPGSDHGLTGESLGRYAALTREANVFLRDDIFQVPTILTDTPGVNDPFLVRDEVTCRALDRSDIFVMVLSAHQALTDVDLGLIRLLSQDNSRDVLIFINRLDELDQYDDHYAGLLKDVGERLDEAIPENDFPILLGSGFMADAVLRDDDAAQALRDELDRPELSTYLKAAYGYVPKEQNERLLLGSGLQKLKDALSERMETGVAQRQLGQILADVRTQIEATSYTSAHTIDAIEADIVRFQQNNAKSLEMSLNSEIISLSKVGEEVDGLIRRADALFGKVVDASNAELENALNAKIDDFIDGQKSMIESSLMLEEDQELPDEPLTIFLGTLHREFEETVSSQYAATRPEIDGKLDSLANFTSQQVSGAFGRDFQDLSLDNLPNDTFSTTLTMAKRSIDTGLVGKRSLAFWRKKSIDISRTFETVKTLATAELKPLVKTLITAHRDAQLARIAEGIERIALTKRVVEHGITDARKRLADHKQQLQDLGVESGDLSLAAQRLQKQSNDLKAQNAALAEIQKRIAAKPQTQAA